ncbi:thioredoxin reductase (NADPH) [Clonorchis sinensis]|uniref:thioredoxin-disulfide reductase (NADPH) n=1 Tax=Clonorchis sinensis TaxID=79923 RepID=G7YV41_CLOSI|nr:thioredoxin reductase (NADPH) [Clonorchis sinensis]
MHRYSTNKVSELNERTRLDLATREEGQFRQQNTSQTIANKQRYRDLTKVVKLKERQLRIRPWHNPAKLSYSTLSLWLWCSMAQHELKEQSAPQTAYLLVALMRILAIAKGYFQLSLFSINSADNNRIHYNSTVRMFLSVKLILVTQIIVSVRFLPLTRLHTAARIILLTQSACGMMIYNPVFLRSSLLQELMTDKANQASLAGLCREYSLTKSLMWLNVPESNHSTAMDSRLNSKLICVENIRFSPSDADEHISMPARPQHSRLIICFDKRSNYWHTFLSSKTMAYYPYMYCAIGEWMMVSAFLVFILLQALELRHFEIRLPELRGGFDECMRLAAAGLRRDSICSAFPGPAVDHAEKVKRSEIRIHSKSQKGADMMSEKTIGMNRAAWKLVHWIRAFPSDRTFRVKEDSTYSSPAPVSIGVPQSSVLRRLMSLIFLCLLIRQPVVPDCRPAPAPNARKKTHRREHNSCIPNKQVREHEYMRVFYPDCLNGCLEKELKEDQTYETDTENRFKIARNSEQLPKSYVSELMEGVGERIRSMVGREQLRVRYQTGERRLCPRKFKIEQINRTRIRKSSVVVAGVPSNKAKEFVKAIYDSHQQRYPTRPEKYPRPYIGFVPTLRIPLANWKYSAAHRIAHPNPITSNITSVTRLGVLMQVHHWLPSCSNERLTSSRSEAVVGYRTPIATFCFNRSYQLVRRRAGVKKVAKSGFIRLYGPHRLRKYYEIASRPRKPWHLTESSETYRLCDSSKVGKLHEESKLLEAVQLNKYDYDLVVIGGGSGGLAASKEAAIFGAKTAVLDFVKPTPKNTVWGLGGTCVNVGCIPKKLMHQAAILGYSLDDSEKFGWDIKKDEVKHDWEKMVEGIQNHIHSLNWGYRVVLRENAVDYLNAYGEIIDAHTIKITKKSGETSTITTNKMILAMGERPRYPDIPGDKEYGITSDDLFSLPYNPGKTLVVGASYVALECAGFLTSLGYDTTVMVRSILLRGFDQQMAEMIGEYMQKHGTKFIRPCVPTSISQVEPADLEKGKTGRYRVTAKYSDGKPFSEEYNTIIFAIGRDPCIDTEMMKRLGIKLDKANRVICEDDEQTSLDNIYAIGDINAGKPQLTPVAIQAGRYLARRLFAGSTELTDYVNVATTVFTPIEYGAIGLSEEDAIAKYGKENITVYHSHFNPLEWVLPHRDDNVCYAKLVCNKAANEQVLGFHVLGPNAGEITQGYAVAMKIGVTKADFDATIGIHPTCSEAWATWQYPESPSDFHHSARYEGFRGHAKSYRLLRLIPYRNAYLVFSTKRGTTIKANIMPCRSSIEARCILGHIHTNKASAQLARFLNERCEICSLEYKAKHLEKPESKNVSEQGFVVIGSVNSSRYVSSSTRLLGFKSISTILNNTPIVMVNRWWVEICDFYGRLPRFDEITHFSKTYYHDNGFLGMPTDGPHRFLPGFREVYCDIFGLHILDHLTPFNSPFILQQCKRATSNKYLPTRDVGQCQSHMSYPDQSKDIQWVSGKLPSANLLRN